MNTYNTEAVLTFFPKVFYINILKEIEFKTIQNKIKKENFVKVGVNEKDLYASTNMNILNNKYLKKIKKKIENEFYNFKNNYLKYNNTDFKLTTSWLTKSEKGEYSHLHKHRNSFYSGILYLQVDNISGDICFENQYNNSFYIIPTESNTYNAGEYFIKPINNMIIFFPSDIHHRILENKSDNIRYSIAFNLMPSSKIGKGDSTYEFI
jgi:uncharacterized protein (TIGR02466 family)